MLPLPNDARIFLHGTPVDLRNGFDGLSFLAHSVFKDEMSPESYFVFFNPRRTRMKILYWSGDNLLIWYIRLRKGVFFSPPNLISTRISAADLKMIINRQTLHHLRCSKTTL